MEQINTDLCSALLVSTSPYLAVLNSLCVSRLFLLCWSMCSSSKDKGSWSEDDCRVLHDAHLEQPRDEDMGDDRDDG